MFAGVVAAERSRNKKIGKCSATHVAQTSCPETCPFYGKGCYAESGPQSWTTARLNKSTANREELANEEAAAIRSLSGKRPLRLHVVGDSSTPEAAQIVSSAAEDYSAKHGAPVWTYTHAWRDVPRASWGSVSVLASCETTQEAKEAMAAGYAAAIVVESYPTERAHSVDGLKILPCPEMTGRAASCAECGLCWRDSTLREKSTVIAFRVHNPTNSALESVKSSLRAKSASLVQIEGGTK